MIRLIVLAAALAAVAPAQAQQQLEANKRNVVEFYNEALNEKNFEAASSTSARATSSTTRSPPTGRRG